MTDILNAQVPSQRWALPGDSDWDRHYNDYEQHINDHYDVETQSIFGRQMTYDEAISNEDLFESFVQDWEDALNEARAERMADDGDW